MTSSRDNKPKMDGRGQPKDTDSYRTLDRAHGRYSATATREASKAMPADQAKRSPPPRRGASRNPNKPVGT